MICKGSRIWMCPCDKPAVYINTESDAELIRGGYCDQHRNELAIAIQNAAKVKDGYKAKQEFIDSCKVLP